MRPRRPVAARLALLPVVAALALALAAPAHAAGERHEDAVRDQVSAGEPAPQPRGDITAISTQHTREAVVVTTRFRRIGPSYLYFATRIWTPEAEYSVVYDAYLSAEGQFELRDEMGTMQWCAGFSGRINEDAGLIRVTVPRTCLDRPAVVRTGALAGPIRRGGSDFRRIIPQPTTDDARLRGRLAGDPAGSVITLGPKVRVG